MDDLLSEFLVETFESLDVVDNELVKFEQDPSDKTVLDNIFRLVHTIKGTCGFLGLPRLEKVAHASETVLGKFRDGEITVTPEIVSLILKSIDTIKELLAHIEAEQVEPDGDDGDIIGQLILAAEGKLESALAEVKSSEAEVSEAEESTASTEQQLGRELLPGEVSLEELEAAFLAAEGPEENASPTPTQEIEAPSTESKPKSASKPLQSKTKGEKDASAKSSESALTAQSIRVSVDVLESLMTTVSELVLTRNQLLQMVRSNEDSEFAAPLQRLSNITAELQDGVMKTRMQPIGNAWQKLPRIVRDISKDLGKKIDLRMVGAETELDRQVLELIKDPLTHMVRNSCDHGLETPEDRIASAKPEMGQLTLRSFHEGGQIVIEVEDDGRGLNLAKIKEKILNKGLASNSELEAMSDHQIYKFVFHAGFSTAAKVTNVSGRGVGMDVVRTNIELIGGMVDLKSATGTGTTFTIKIPLTLAIVSALIVESGGFKFAVPQLNVVELVRAGAASEASIEQFNEKQVLRLRNRILPLISLSEALGVNRPAGDLPKETDAESAVPSKATTRKDSDADFVVVVQVANKNIGIIVDNVFDTEEIVVKPAATILRELSIYSGTTILGDGSVIMIIDPTSVVSKLNQELDDKSQDQDSDERHVNINSDTTSLLVFRAGTDAPKAVPLALVTRLEEIPVELIEKTNKGSVVQYRGGLMPLIHPNLDNTFVEKGRQPVLVFTEDDKSMGLAVDSIEDIVDDKLDIEMLSDQPGVIGSAIVKEKATDIIDVSHYLKLAGCDWFDRGKTTTPNSNGRRKILLIDDSAFFRNLITPLLNKAGYDVTSVSSVKDAWSLRSEGSYFDVIVSDIEMPETDGFGFAKEAREDSEWKNIPIVALSAIASPDYVQKGQEAGFDTYVSKSDHEGLITALEQAIDLHEDAA